MIKEKNMCLEMPEEFPGITFCLCSEISLIFLNRCFQQYERLLVFL